MVSLAALMAFNCLCSSLDVLAGRVEMEYLIDNLAI